MYGIMLIVKDLTVVVAEKQVISGISLELGLGSFHVLMGPNGSGKSSFAQTILGSSLYTVVKGSLVWKGLNLSELEPEERARQGVFVTFQNPPAIPGVSVFSFLKETYTLLHNKGASVADFHDMLRQYMQQLGLDESFCARSLNDGFSGGERKRFEMLQILLLRPALIILDELDSGIDVDGINLLAAAIAQIRDEAPETIFLCITHHAKLVQQFAFDAVHVLQKGQLIASGGPALLANIEEHGYAQQALSASVNNGMR